MSNNFKIPSVLFMGGINFIRICVPFPTPLSPCPNSQGERKVIIKNIADTEHFCVICTGYNTDKTYKIVKKAYILL